MEINDFRRSGEGITYTYQCEIAPLIFNFRQRDGKNDFQIFGYGKGIQSEYLCRVGSIEECNLKLKEYLEKLELILEVTDSPNYSKFLKSIKKVESSPVRNDRLKIKSSDNEIEMFVEYNHRYGYFAMVRDVCLETGEIKDGQLRPAMLTEKEAECIVQEAMNEYELKGHYTRKLLRTPRICFEHEYDERVAKAVNSLNENYMWVGLNRIPLTLEQATKIKAMLYHEII